jgi:aryl-alcohol dehydrogenase-like predicted oxidoreductase
MTANQNLLDKLEEIARVKDAIPAQLALARVLHQGDFIVPIPGARQIRHLEDNCAAADLKPSDTELNAIAQPMPPEAVNGSRYSPEALASGNG